MAPILGDHGATGDGLLNLNLEQLIELEHKGNADEQRVVFGPHLHQSPTLLTALDHLSVKPSLADVGVSWSNLLACPDCDLDHLLTYVDRVLTTYDVKGTARQDLAGVLMNMVVDLNQRLDEGLQGCCPPWRKSALYVVCSQILYTCASVGAPPSLAPLVRLMDRCEEGLSADSYKGLMMHALKTGRPPELLEDMLAELMGWGKLPGRKHYELLLQCYANHGDCLEALDTLRRMQGLGLMPTPQSYYHIFQGLALRGQVERADEVFREMLARGVPLDVTHFTFLFKTALVRAQDVRIFSARASSQVATYEYRKRKRLLGLRSQNFQHLYQYLSAWQQEMVRLKVQHNDWSLKFMVRALEKVERVEDCLVLAKVFEKNLPGNFIPHTMAMRRSSRKKTFDHLTHISELTSRLQAGGAAVELDHVIARAYRDFWLHEDLQVALKAFSGIPRHKLKGNTQYYAAVINLQSIARRWKDVLRSLDTMTREGCRVEDGLWHVILRCLAASKTPPEIVEKFRELMGTKDWHRLGHLYMLSSERKEVVPLEVAVTDDSHEDDVIQG